MSMPTTPAPTLEDWQFQFNNLQLGSSTPYDIYEIDGLDFPVVRSADQDRALENGQLIGLDLYTGRDITITGDIVQGPDAGSLQASSVALSSAFPLGVATEQPFWFKFPNLPPLCSLARTRKRTVPVDLGFSVNALAQLALQLHATDPRLYATPQSSSCGVASGFNTLTVTNYGNVEMRPAILISGQVVNPVIYNATTGWTFGITGTVNTGDLLIIDTDLHTATYYVGGTGSGISVRQWINAGSTWPSTINAVGGVAPGANLFEFSAGAVTTGLYTIQYASAYIL